VPTASKGQVKASNAKPQIAVPVSPPAGSLANVVTVGAPNQAGNTAVIQVFGSRPKINGIAQVQPTTDQPAAVPGVPGLPGVPARNGGGPVKAAHHSSASSLGWLLALLISMAIVGVGWWGGRRRKPEPPPDLPMGPPGPPDPQPAEAIQPGRQLVFAGKGDGS
jgi:hypothetical protein